jgi:hypothetical protein
MSEPAMSPEEMREIGKLVGQIDAMVEEELREGLIDHDCEQNMLRGRATMMKNFRAILSREPEVQEEAKQYFVELHRIMNRPQPSADSLDDLLSDEL